MTDDEKYLDLLAIFHYILGALTALVSCVFFLHLAIGIAMLCKVFDEKNAPPKFIAWFFIVFSVVIISLGWTLAGFIIASGLRIKKRVSRTFCLVLAGLECMLMPLGTVLGVFTIVVLMKDSVKSLFSNANAIYESQKITDCQPNTESKTPG